MSSQSRQSITALASLIQILDVPFTHPASRIIDTDLGEPLGSIDRHTVESGLTAVGDIISAIRAGRQQAEDLLAYIRTREAEMEYIQTRYQNLLAPIRVLPNEILAEIFIFVRAMEDQGTGVPTIVAQVNQHWRRVALNTPQLWTNIVVRLGRDQSIGSRDVELWLERSGACLLSLVFTSGVKTATWARSGRPRVEDTNTVNSILSQSHRIGSMTFKAHTPRVLITTAIQNSLRSPTFQLPSLKTLKFPERTHERDAKWMNDLAIFACTNSPSLDTLLFWPWHPVGALPFPLRSLRILRGHIDPTRLVSMFSSPHPIEVLDIHVPFSWEEFTAVASYPTFQHLTALSLETERLPTTTAYFPAFPSLRYLLLTQRSNLDTDISPLLRTWGPGLLYLGIPESLSADSIQSCLALTPKLEGFRITDFPQIKAIPFREHPSLAYLDVNLISFEMLEGDSLGPVESTLTTQPGMAIRVLTLCLYLYSESVEKCTRKIGHTQSKLSAIGIDVRWMVAGAVAGSSEASLSFDTPYFKEKCDPKLFEAFF